MAKAEPFDAAEYLDSPEMIAAYINEALGIRRCFCHRHCDRHRPPVRAA